MGGLACAEKIARNYGVLAAEADALATDGPPFHKEAVALSTAAQAMCMAYVAAYDDPKLDDDGRAKLIAVQRKEGRDAVEMAMKMRAFRDHGDNGLNFFALRQCRDAMVKAFGDVFAELMHEYYPPPATP